MAKRATAGPKDHVVELRDGRSLGYADLGDPDGYPVVHCHGGLVSRNDIADADDIARDLGLRILSPDRPGIALSDRKPGHGILDWARTDVADLLDRLGIDRVSVLGWSAGGQHALAVAHAHPDRVDRVVAVAGCLPVDDLANRAQLSRLDQRTIRLCTRATPVAKAYFTATRLFAERAPARLAASSAAELEGDETGALVARAAWFGQIMAEGSTHPAGQVDDYRAYAAPWGFAPEDITVPVHVHHGTEDRLVPVAWADELGRRIPDATVTIHPGGGHLIIATRAEAILPDLLPPT